MPEMLLQNIAFHRLDSRTHRPQLAEDIGTIAPVFDHFFMPSICPAMRFKRGMFSRWLGLCSSIVFPFSKVDAAGKNNRFYPKSTAGTKKKRSGIFPAEFICSRRHSHRRICFPACTGSYRRRNSLYRSGNRRRIDSFRRYSSGFYICSLFLFSF